MKKILMLLAFALPAIPAVWVALDLMIPSPNEYRGMHPFAAAGWGFAVYFIIISGEGMLLILVKTIRSFWRDDRDRKNNS